VYQRHGLGTRFLPATKSVPKEIMTLVDRPLIQYAIDEARDAGIEEFIFVTSRGKGALEDYFDRAPELEKTLRDRGKTGLLAALEATEMDSGTIAYVRQHRPLGLGHAVGCARRLLSDEPFAVILPDDVTVSDPPCLRQLLEAHAETGGNMVAALEVPDDETSSYGILDIGDDMGSVVSVRGMVEKPTPGTAPSNLAVIGRYVLTPKVMEILGRIESGAHGEVQLTDAIAATGDVFAYRFGGQRYDCGSKAGFLRATVALALARPDLRDDFLDCLSDTLSLRRAAQ